MQMLRYLRRHPLLVLGAIAVAFVGWLWRDAVTESLRGPLEPEVAHFEIVGVPPDHQRPTLTLDTDERPQPNPNEKAQSLFRLKPGMTRAEVEGLVGAPTADHIHPVTVLDGQVTYSTSYEADLGPAPTVRPIRPHHRLPIPAAQPRQATGPTVVTLQFDATKPGHPLMGIFYPDPLF